MNDPASVIRVQLWGNEFAFQGGAWSRTRSEDSAQQVMALQAATPDGDRHTSAMDMVKAVLSAFGAGIEAIVSADHVADDEVAGVA